MNVSAVICTCNRLPYLRKSVDSLLRQSCAPGLFEIVIVDNASTDGTAAWAQELARTQAAIVYVHEPEPGLSRARNTAWRRAATPIVAFLDDDAVACPTWIASIVAAFDASEARCAAVGGPIRLIWEAPRPAWLHDDGLAFLSASDYGPERCVVDKWRPLVGANVAFRRSALEAIGGFPVNLGMTGKKIRGNEESFVHHALLNDGWHCVYDPAIEVGHHAPAAKLNKAWFRKRSFGQGVSDGEWVHLTDTPSTRHRVALAAASAWKMCRRCAACAGWRLRGDPRSAFYAECIAWRELGCVLRHLNLVE